MMKLKLKKMTGIVVLAVTFCMSVSLWAVPAPMQNYFNLQGKLKDSSGNALHGYYWFKFKLYEVHDVNDQTKDREIAESIPPKPYLVRNGLGNIPVPFSSNYFLGDARNLEVYVSINQNGPWDLLKPRIRLRPNPYAFYAKKAGYAETTGSSGPDMDWEITGNDMYSKVSGNIGIGTTSPVTPIHVKKATPSILLEESDQGDKRWHIAGFNRGMVISESGIGDRLYIKEGGKVGIGTTNPSNARLEVHAIGDPNENDHSIYANNPGNGTKGILGFRSGSDPIAAGVYGENSHQYLGTLGGWNDVLGHCGVYGHAGDGKENYGGIGLDTIGVFGHSATGYAGYFQGKVGINGELRCNNNNGVQTVRLMPHAWGQGCQLDLKDSSGVTTHQFTGSGSTYQLFNSSGIGTIVFNGETGRTKTKILEILGADLAEKFPVSEEVKPGMVVAIDPDNPGQLRLSRGAYNPCVAGVVSGANGLSVGAILGNLPGEENAPPIALSGRVWVNCDASRQSIKPGDLLTTSDTPGHAMKATDREKTYGAVIGKAMTPLESGNGLVLVLVNLQ